MQVDIYIKKDCPFCQRAEMLLTKRNVDYRKIDINDMPDAFETMKERSGGRNTVPQIFVGDTHIGGCDDFSMMPRAQFMALLDS